jgi:hypothetical protein
MPIIKHDGPIPFLVQQSGSEFIWRDPDNYTNTSAFPSEDAAWDSALLESIDAGKLPIRVALQNRGGKPIEFYARDVCSHFGVHSWANLDLCHEPHG